jgi:hypothetical protein
VSPSAAAAAGLTAAADADAARGAASLALTRMQPPVPHSAHLGQWRSTAIAGNDLLSSSVPAHGGHLRLQRG